MGNNNGVQKVDDYMKQLYSSIIYDSNEIKKLRNNIKECFGIKELEKFDKTLKDIGNTTKNTKITTPIKNNNFGKSLKTALGIGTVALGIRKAVGFLKDATTESIDFVETQNLFNVSMGRTVDQYGNLDKEASKYYTKAIAFQEKLSEKLGINIEESMEYQALFNAMSKSMGISADKAYLLSENFTKLGYDLSSLYNIETQNAMDKLRAGLAGQTKPLRDLGLDITQQSLEPLLDELGIERSVKQLSQAEKMVARYIVVLRQAKIAQGDFAKTTGEDENGKIMSLANQLKIFNAQVTAFKRNMGNLWQGLLGGILPYINAVMMVINELLKMVAKLFGFKFESQNISAGIGADDLADDLGTATGKAKELKKQLMGFDEIHNITLDKNSSGGSGASVGGIDQRLLDAMKEYDNLMDKVKSKADDIRDKMMEWLGFERIGDNWKLKEGLTNAEKILDVMKTIGITIGTWKVAKTVTDLFAKLGILNKEDPSQAFKLAFGITLTVTGVFAQYKGTKHLLDGDIDIFSLLETLLGTTAGTWGIVNILQATKKGKELGLKKQIAIGLGVMLAFQAVQVIADGIKTGDIRKQILGTLELGGATLLGVSAIAGWQIALPIALGVMITATIVEVLGNSGAFFSEYTEKLKESIEKSKELSKAIEDCNTSYLNQKQAIQESAISKSAELQYVENLKGKLVELVDENGKVISGYEGRVDFILGELNSALGTEYEAEEGIIKNYQDMQKEIDNIIKAKKKEIEQEAYAELYKEAIKKQIEDTRNQVKAQEEYNKVREYGNKLVEDAGAWWKVSIVDMDKYNKALEEAEGNLNSTNQALSDSSNEVTFFSTQFDNLASSAVEATGAISTEVSQNVIDTTENMKKLANENTTEFVAKLQEMNEATKANVLAQATTVSTLSPEVQNEWNKLANGSRENFITAINQVPIDAQGAILRSITEVNGLNEATKEAWLNLSKTSAEEFYKNISQVEPMTRGQILASIAGTEELTDETKKAWETLSKEDNKAYNAGIASLDDDTSKKIQSAINEIDKKQGSMNTAGSNLANEGIKGANNKTNDETTGIKSVGGFFVQGFLNALTGGQYSVWKAGWDLVKSAIKGGREAQDSHSPSKETLKLGNYFTEGYIIGLNKKQKELRKTAGNLVGVALNEMEQLNDKGITVDPNDFKIDTNQFIDYGQISGAIATQSNINVSSDIESRIENAIYNAFSNVKIPVEIEAKTEEGVIVKKVSKGFNEYIMQTGELPFPIPT